MYVPTLKSNFAILDVKSGRKGLAKAIAKGLRVPVTIVGWIDCQHDNDDGISIEFQVDVTSVSAGEAEPAA